MSDIPHFTLQIFRQESLAHEWAGRMSNEVARGVREECLKSKYKSR